MRDVQISVQPSSIQNLKMKKLISTHLFLIFHCLFANGQGEIEKSFTLDSASISNLKLQFAQVEVAPVGKPLRATGVVRLDERNVYDVTPRINGFISRSVMQLGDRVRSGDVLCEIQSAELSEMISNYVAAEEAMVFGAAAAEQERKLAEKNLSSAEQLRQRELELKQAISAHARALQPLKLLSFDEGTIHQFLASGDASDYTTLELKASGDGEIIVRNVRNGAAVQHDHLLFTIADLSELWIDFQVALRDAPSLAIGDSVEVQSSVTDKVQNAKIIHISPLADEQSRTVMIRATFKNPEGRWRPGTPVQVVSAGKSGGVDSLAVPAGAIIDFDGGKAVFIHRGENTFACVPVEIGASDGKMTQLTGGLTRGQTVVSTNAAQLKGHLEMTAGE
jgi:cobalt-zinc-cadmium efflux system membrane fusion protein